MDTNDTSRSAYHHQWRLLYTSSLEGGHICTCRILTLHPGRGVPLRILSSDDHQTPKILMLFLSGAIVHLAQTKRA